MATGTPIEESECARNILDDSERGSVIPEQQEGAGNNADNAARLSAAERLSADRPREPHLDKLTQLMFAVFKFCFGSLGLWVDHWWSYVPRIIVSLICIYQAVYYMFVVLGCKGFDCRLPDENVTHHKAHRGISNAVDTIASLGAVLSYGLFVICFILAKRRDSALVSPADTMAKNLDKKDALQLCRYFVFITALYLCSVVVFYVIARPNEPPRLVYTRITGVASQFFAQWTAITTCHIFAVSSFTLGTFAQDTLRWIQSKKNLDDIIRIHEALHTVVFNTVSTYKWWFVLHWLSYGAVVVLSVIYLSYEISSRIKYGKPILKLVHSCLIFVCHLYLFLVPCFFAARITSCCSGIYDDINIAIPSKWNEGHPFRDRSNTALFLSYVKDRQCGFKIGRIRFNTSLAWLSLFLGLTGLLYHFVQ